MSDIFSPTPAKANKTPKPKKRPRRVGQTLKRLWDVIDNPDTPIVEKIELVKRAERLVTRSFKA
jgi:hypothetical protein